MKITFAPVAAKYLRKMPEAQRRTIMTRIKLLAERPWAENLDIDNLGGRAGYRMRVGGYRVMFIVEGEAIIVTLVRPRGDVYKR